MEKCSLCDISGDVMDIYRGIHKGAGIVNICHKCYLKERIPLIEGKKIDWENVDKRVSVRERLSTLANVNVNKTEIVTKRWEKPENVELKDIVERNTEKKISIGPKTYDDLIDNFNWTIMRARRAKKMSRTELAEAVHEPTIIIEALERGALPRDYILLIKKLESYLGINLSKVKDRRIISPNAIISESKVPTGLRISDLRRKSLLERDVEQKALNEIVEERFKEGDWNEEDLEEDSLSLEELNLEKVKKIIGEPIQEKSDKDELSDEDIGDLIWGRK